MTPPEARTLPSALDAAGPPLAAPADDAASAAALREQDTRLHLALSAAQMGAWDYEFATDTLSWSPEIFALFGLPRQPVHRGLIRALIHPDDVGADDLAMEAAIRAKGNYHAQYRVCHDGRVEWVEDRGVIQYAPDGTPLRVIGLAQNITARKRAETELEAHRDRLERLVAERTAELVVEKERAEAASKAKGQFLANMSHEIRTPLNGVLGLAQIGHRESLGRPELREIFAQILESGRLLHTVLNDVLDFSKMEVGKLRVEAVPFSPLRVVEAAVRGFREPAEARGLRLTVTVHDLPAACLGDPVRVEQVLLNLLSNAVKFTEAGEVRLEARRVGAELVFRVADTGPGIAPADLDRLFEPFEQADSSTTRRFGGTGLGLSISRRLAELLGGSLQAESRLDVGSTFELRLPLRESAALPPERLGPPAAAGRRRLAGRELLVAEDNAINRIVLEDLLRAEGARVLAAEDGLHALEVLAAHPTVDLVLMDVQMPRMDGLEATRRIHTLRPGLPVVGQTAHALPEEHQKCREAGMRATITKPIDGEVVVAAVLRELGPAGAPPAEAARPGGPAAPIPVDWAGLAERYPHRPDFIDRLAGLAQKAHRDDPARLRGLAAAGQIEAVAELAHELRGVGGNLLAPEVFAAAGEALLAARAADASTAPKALALADAVERLLHALARGRPA